MPLRQPRRAGLVLETGQTTQYASELDDGYYEMGLAKRYEVLTTDQYAGTTNIDVPQITRADIAFTAATKTVSAGQDLGTILAGDLVTFTGSVNNTGVYTVNVGGSASFTVLEDLVDEGAGASITINKREAHSNACVLDNNTGLMWSRTASDKVGDGSDGLLPWTRVAPPQCKVSHYALGANTSGLAGYTSGWRTANKKEIESLIDDENNPSGPNTTAFPDLPATPTIWTSTTSKKTTTSAWAYAGANEGEITPQAKTTDSYVLLVRGG